MQKYNLPDLPKGYRWKIVNDCDQPKLGIQKRFFGIWVWVLTPKSVWVNGTLMYPKVEQFDMAIEHTAVDLLHRFRELNDLDTYFKTRKIRRAWW